MTHQLMQLGRKFAALVATGTLCVLVVAEPLMAQASSLSQNAEAAKARVRYLHANGSHIEVALADGTRLLGRIIRVGEDAFTLKEDKTGREAAWRYAQVIEVKKTGLSGRAKALTAAMIGGAVLLVLCVAPFPLGFLCQEDPS